MSPKIKWNSYNLLIYKGIRHYENNAFSMEKSCDIIVKISILGGIEMKKTKIVKALSVIMCVIITVTGMCIPASAAVKGSTMDNAITVSFGQSYSKSWTKKTLRVNC